MNTYATFQTPQKVLYGPDSFQQVGKEAAAKGKKALIITDPIMAKLGYVEQCRQLLAAEGLESIVYQGVASEPTDAYVVEALDLLRDEACDVVLSLGGGSCIDTAKAIVVLERSGGYIGDYLGGKKACLPPGIAHIAIPTTAGTGSEATDVTVITNTQTHVKMMIKHPAFMPAVAIVDPALTRSAPPHVIAATGIDALCHAIEAYLSKKAHPMTKMLAYSAVTHIVHSLQRSYEDPHDLDAKERMCIGSLQAGMAFSNASVTLVHGMSRPIGALFHVPHGISNAMLLPAVLEFTQPSCIEELAELMPLFVREQDAEPVTLKERADYTIRQVKELCRNLQIPNLRSWGIPEQEFHTMLEKMARDAWDSGSPSNNPRVPTIGEIMDLYRICYDYSYSCDRMTQ
ncbi:iron-containing alcohol dehydrogenase [Brevibacillus panacihumi]|uniref:Iron-containing alcohol dehydrogenase n=1 Tax=Brevibacillus panacihumi TaxID=497735 RepID=A0A3M8CKF4_9BACL|nr:iron-containing alcohol dehydrogenase [Brevibacillus panacihumi]RNB76242.1 iron-containing alcohol dehydrogenase [Brevibacillus panacihumi]